MRLVLGARLRRVAAQRDDVCGRRDPNSRARPRRFRRGVAPTQVRCAAGVSDVSLRMRSTVGGCARGSNRRHRRSRRRNADAAARESWIDSHRVCSIFSVFGGKNSKLTCDVAARFGEQRQVVVEALEGVHAALRWRNGLLGAAPQSDGQLAALQMLDLVDARGPPTRTSRPSPRPRSRDGCGRRVARSSSRSCAAKSTTSSVPPGASTRAASAIAVAGECA